MVKIFYMKLCKLDVIKDWNSAKTVMVVETISSKDNDPKGATSAEWRYFLSNHQSSDKRLPSYIGNHWSIENKLH